MDFFFKPRVLGYRFFGKLTVDRFSKIGIVVLAKPIPNISIRGVPAAITNKFGLLIIGKL